jgi:hypothetical protein
VLTNIRAAQYKKYQVKELKGALKESIIIMSQSFRLSREPEKYGITSQDCLRRISAIHTISTSLMRSLFHELSEIDKPFDGQKLNYYVKTGLITSKWVWEQAATYTDNDSIEQPKDLPDNTHDWFEIDDKNNKNPESDTSDIE